MKAVVDPLIAGKKTVAEKEAAIVDYLDREVRYTGIEFGEAAIVPHDPAETLAKKYGDCKDKATLLVVMLRAAGIPAYVALLSVESRMDVPADLPGMGMFDHAIVYVPGKNPIWIDATDRYAQLGQIPMGDQGRLALITSDATTALDEDPGVNIKGQRPDGDARGDAGGQRPRQRGRRLRSPRASTSRATAATTPTSPTTIRARACADT